MSTQRYWVAVVSKDHTMRGVAGGFMQVCHGKEAPLKRTAAGDMVIFYSPNQSMNGDIKCQSFTAIGEVLGQNVYPFQMSNDFIPFRRDVKFYECEQIPILPLIPQLEFITDKSKWGFQFRFGFFEIRKGDFELIAGKMMHDETRREAV